MIDPLDELRQFQRVLEARLEAGSNLNLDEVVAEWKLQNSNRPVAAPYTTKVSQPSSRVAEYHPQPVMDQYELHFLEHGHD